MRTFHRSLMATLAAAAIVTLAGCGPDYPNCEGDNDCHEGEYCVNGHCQQCREDSDCPAGHACTGGRCDEVTGFCQSAGDCPNGQECRDNRCVAAESVQSLPEPEPAAPGACEVAPIYFAFDADLLDSTARNEVERNVRCMRERGIEAVHVTGLCDPRGTEEYNLALGDRRAQAVRQFMVSLGIADDKVTSSSMGEEMAQGADEPSWARDRRVDFQPR